MSVINPDDKLFTRAELAKELGCTVQHLENLAMRGDGPPFVPIGRLVRYPKSAFTDWLANRLVTSTTAARRIRRSAAKGA